MSVKTPTRRARDSYFALVKRFPVRRLRSEADYRAARAVARDVMRRGTVDELDAGAGDYLEALAKFIEEYESGAFPIRSRAPRETLRFLMEQHGMRAIDLAAIVGGTGAASMLLKGDREPSKAQIRKLAEHFHVSPALFL
jgi:HTH-type transcriptional regulator/antitoxin HigA